MVEGDSARDRENKVASEHGRTLLFLLSTRGVDQEFSNRRFRVTDFTSAIHGNCDRWRN